MLRSISTLESAGPVVFSTAYKYTALESGRAAWEGGTVRDRNDSRTKKAPQQHST